MLFFSSRNGIVLEYNEQEENGLLKIYITNNEKLELYYEASLSPKKNLRL